jgi:hypothetical protein
MAFKWLLLTGVLLATASITFSQARALRSPVFTKDGELVLPSGFRQWVFIGGPLTPNGLNNGKAPFPEFHDVYIQQANLRFYQAHGSFPEGTVIVKELALTQAGTYTDGSINSASGRGYFPGALHGLDVMVKDSKRFSGTHDWGFFTFGHHAPPYEGAARVMEAGQCASCHIAGVAKTDMVWVQFYPLLHTKLQ